MLNLSKGSNINIAKEASGVTGDNPKTACSIAKDANISNKPNYMLGCDIAGQTMSNLTKTDVFARTRPEDKQELVKKFQQIGEVVAILIACVGPFIGVDLPFTVTQMLLVNLIMDILAALQLMML